MIGVSLGGIGGVIPLIIKEPNLKKLLIMRNCKHGEVKWARRVLPTIFKVNPGTIIAKKESLEGQLSYKGFEVYVQCIKSPWKLVVRDLERFLESREILVGDVACGGTFYPNRCSPSALGMAALGKRKGQLVVLNPGKPPSDVLCVAQVLMRTVDCLKEKVTLKSGLPENVLRIIDYLVSTSPSSVLLEIKKNAFGTQQLYSFNFECFYSKLEYLEELRLNGPIYLKKLRCVVGEGEKEKLIEFIKSTLQ